MDEADSTQDRMEAEAELRRLQRERAEVRRGPGPEFCESCGNDMPGVRRAYGYRQCVECARAAEKNSTHFYKPER